MNLKISRGEEARKFLVRYAFALSELEGAEKAAQKYDEENPFAGGGAYSSAGWENNATRRELWNEVSRLRSNVEASERELRALAAFLLEDARKDEPARTLERSISYPWEVDSATIEKALEVISGLAPGKRKAIQLRFENPNMITVLTSKLFSQGRVEKGRVFAYAVARENFDEASAPASQSEAILALLPISPEAEQEALLFANSSALLSLFAHAYLEAREEIERRDQLTTKLKEAGTDDKRNQEPGR